ncbi:MAG: transcription factor IIS helical bundle-like domain-containing protein [Deltaproteobacteria bacterium]|nr:transcription factor IIS helical bundle-like domain-containing protein [Deltaproteobacteria bacterium]
MKSYQFILITIVLLFSACASTQKAPMTHEEQAAHVEDLMHQMDRGSMSAIKHLWNLGYRQEVVPYLGKALAKRSARDRMFALSLLNHIDNPPPNIVKAVELMGKSEPNRKVRKLARRVLQRWKVLELTKSE